MFRSSDNISINILVTNDGLLSIDEGDLFGKRQIIFNKMGDVCKKDVCYKENVDKVMDKMFGKEGLKERLETELIKHGFEKNLEEFRQRFDNYRAIVKAELE